MAATPPARAWIHVPVLRLRAAAVMHLLHVWAAGLHSHLVNGRPQLRALNELPPTFRVLCHPTRADLQGSAPSQKEATPGTAAPPSPAQLRRCSARRWPPPSCLRALCLQAQAASWTAHIPHLDTLLAGAATCATGSTQGSMHMACQDSCKQSEGCCLLHCRQPSCTLASVHVGRGMCGICMILHNTWCMGPNVLFAWTAGSCWHGTAHAHCLQVSQGVLAEDLSSTARQGLHRHSAHFCALGTAVTCLPRPAS